jgi:CheY-like chemotaxis protein
MPNGGELWLRARNATDDEKDGLAGAPGRKFVLISVADDGSGIDPAIAARVFEPFFTTKPVGKGTGLGLSQVLGFCVQAGGTARVASTPGVGTTVSLLLPALEADESAAAAVRPDAAAGHTVPPGACILLVEDNEELAQLTAALLQTHGLQIVRAANAAEALQLLRAPHRIDLVLSDVVMPGEMDGLALARQLHRDQPQLPVVLVSGYSDSAAIATEFKVLRKPCAEDELVRTLAAALSGQRLARAPSVA